MSAPLVLSLFPGIGLLDMAFEEAGFCVVRGPDPEHSALASGGGRPVPVAIGGSGKLKRGAKSALRNYGYKTGDVFENHKRLQGLPADFDLPPFTTAAKVKAIGNGVPLAMGRAVAAAVCRAVGFEPQPVLIPEAAE